MWTRTRFNEVICPAAIGMVHLLPLPGSPCWQGEISAVRDHALIDVANLVAGGISAVMVENYNDIPFYPESVPAETIAAMTHIIGCIGNEYPDLALGVNVLRNDAEAALGIALAIGAQMIRVNVHVGATVTDQGTIQGRAWHTMRKRRELGAQDIAILADVRVKHARPLVERPIGEEAQDLRYRGQADAIIVTGVATGSGASVEELKLVRAALPDCPLLIGSGMTAANVSDFAAQADGYIVGSSLKTQDSSTGLPVVSSDKTASFLSALALAHAKG